jgi:hypothetical protein
VAPSGRSRIVVATSITRKPLMAEAINASDVWYCRCWSVIAPVRLARKARIPHAGSVIRCRSNTLTTPPKKITPA